MSRNGKTYNTRYGKVRVIRVKGGGKVIMDPKGNVINVKSEVSK